MSNFSVSETVRDTDVIPFKSRCWDFTFHGYTELDIENLLKFSKDNNVIYGFQEIRGS